MLWIGFILRAWVIRQKRRGLKPRVLADDIFLLAENNEEGQMGDADGGAGEGQIEEMEESATVRQHPCPDSYQQTEGPAGAQAPAGQGRAVQEAQLLDGFVRGFEDTLQFFLDIGARISIPKSFVCSNVRVLRKELRGLDWPQLKGKKLQVLNHTRDLGTHATYAGRYVGATLVARAKEAVATARRARRLPHPKHAKARLARTVVLAKALYGCEAAPLSDQVTRQLQAALTKLVGSPADRACNALTFDLCSAGQDLDPVAQILARRVVMGRRMIAKRPARGTVVKKLLHWYKEAEQEGTMQDHTYLPALVPAPPPGDPGATAWKGKIRACGPISLLLGSLHRAAAVIDEQLVIHQDGEVPVRIMDIPWQELRGIILRLVSRARFKFAALGRRALSEWDSMDPTVTLRCISRRPGDEQAILKGVATLARWDE